MRVLNCNRGVKLFTLRVFAVAKLRPGTCGQGKKKSKVDESNDEADGVKEERLEKQSARKGEGGERGCGLFARRGGRRDADKGAGRSGKEGRGRETGRQRRQGREMRGGGQEKRREGAQTRWSKKKKTGAGGGVWVVSVDCARASKNPRWPSPLLRWIAMRTFLTP